MKKRTKLILLSTAIFIVIILVQGKLFLPERLIRKIDEKTANLELLNKLKPAILKARTTPITFYGKVLDQNDNPVPDVQVSGSMASFAPNPVMFCSASVGKVIL